MLLRLPSSLHSPEEGLSYGRAVLAKVQLGSRQELGLTRAPLQAEAVDPSSRRLSMPRHARWSSRMSSSRVMVLNTSTCSTAPQQGFTWVCTRLAKGEPCELTWPATLCQSTAASKVIH